jgi:hypothetical protein
VRPAGFFLFLTILFALFTRNGYTQDTVIGGVSVSFGLEKRMFPCSWHRKTIDAQATPMAASAVPRVKGIMVRAFSKYPAGMPGKYLERIFVEKNLRFYGYPYGGSYSKKTIYLTLDDTNPLNTDQFLEERFHHELSSILWVENIRLLDLEKWKSFNAPGFIYGEGGLDAIRSGIAAMDTDPGYFGIGFINRYAMTEIEQDINVVAQNLFCGGMPFWKIVDGNERIRGKVVLLIGFYHALDDVFTEEYFRNLN